MSAERPTLEQCPRCRNKPRYRERKNAKGVVVKVCDVCKGKGFLVIK